MFTARQRNVHVKRIRQLAARTARALWLALRAHYCYTRLAFVRCMMARVSESGRTRVNARDVRVTCARLTRAS